jgi:hypothetical protein
MSRLHWKECDPMRHARGPIGGAPEAPGRSGLLWTLAAILLLVAVYAA